MQYANELNEPSSDELQGGDSSPTIHPSLFSNFEPFDLSICPLFELVMLFFCADVLLFGLVL
jgi:hypothetical protein